jgi:hypothetical protein
MHASTPLRRTLGFLMRDTARLMRRRFVQRARAVGRPLNRSEAAVLVHVDNNPGMSQAATCRPPGHGGDLAGTADR